MKQRCSRKSLMIIEISGGRFLVSMMKVVGTKWKKMTTFHERIARSILELIMTTKQGIKIADLYDLKKNLMVKLSHIQGNDLSKNGECRLD